MTITKEQLLFDLFVAFYDAARHKYSKDYVKYFQKNLLENLISIRDDLFNRIYVAEPSTCFIADRPKKREIFAANFRDRVVQHLYYNYVHEMFERTFITDTYSCIKYRGTSFGIERLTHHIRSESNDWKEPCYALKIDIKGYFINIRKDILLKIVNEELDKFEYKFCNKEQTKQCGEILDFDLLRYLSKEIIMLDPTSNCKQNATAKDYIGLPLYKSLFGVDRIKGLPVGNITSQLFSNIYMNRYDQFVKRVLKVKHYGRYVDDSYYVSKDKQFLLNLIPQITKFLKTELDLDVNQGKTHLIEVKYGVEFLGAFIKPFRTYISNQALYRMKKSIKENETNMTSQQKVQSAISRIGLLKQYKSYNIIKELFYKQKIQYLSTGFFYSSSYWSSSISSSTLSLTAFASSAIFSFPLLNL